MGDLQQQFEAREREFQRELDNRESKEREIKVELESKERVLKRK